MTTKATFQELHLKFIMQHIIVSETCLKYIQEKFQISHDVISNLFWIDVNQHCELLQENVQFFLDRYSTLKSFESLDHDKVYEQSINYQTLHDDYFLVETFDDPKVIEGKVDKEEVYHDRMDTMWFRINKIKIASTTMKRFKFPPKVADVVLVLAHSNADLERLISIVRKNKTDARSSLKLDGVTFFHLSYEIKVSSVCCTMSQIPTRLSYD